MKISQFFEQVYVPSYLANAKDEDFQSLFNAFNNETEYPKHLPKEKRPMFWQTIMIFVSITAVRREVILGMMRK
jgi:hypothetical protein